MLGLDGWTLSEDVKSGKIVPFRPFPRLQVASLAGFLPREDAPVIWRGPLRMLAVRRFLMDVAWGTLDFLLVDTPPGTGDEPLGIAQLIPDADGVLLVTTPQEISLLDVRRSARFVRHMNLPVLGILENMSGLRCPHCGDAIPLFRQGAGRRLAEELQVPFLGSLPIAEDLPAHCDRGHPYVLRETTDAWIETLENVRHRLLQAVQGHGSGGP
jgi:ATP-binding protein involved in chromosome partitioning